MVAKRALANSGIEVAPLALGGNVFGWTADENASFAVLDAFVDAGGTMIDTADVYSAWVPGHHGGESEATIGRWLNRNPSKREKVVIATKVGMANGLAPEVIRTSCEASLRRLGIDRIDLYYQHKDDDKVPLEDSLGAFETLLEDGKIRTIGLSNFRPDRIEEVFAVVERLGLTKPVALQPRYNLIDRTEFEQDLRPVAKRENLSVFPYYGLASGFLTGKYRTKDDLGKSQRGNRVKDYLNGKGLRILGALDEISRETGASLATISLSWLMAQPSIVAPLASATRVEQLNELVAAMDFRLDPEQFDLLDRATLADGQAFA